MFCLTTGLQRLLLTYYSLLWAFTCNERRFLHAQHVSICLSSLTLQNNENVERMKFRFSGCLEKKNNQCRVQKGIIMQNLKKIDWVSAKCTLDISVDQNSFTRLSVWNNLPYKFTKCMWCKNISLFLCTCAKTRHLKGYSECCGNDDRIFTIATILPPMW